MQKNKKKIEAKVTTTSAYTISQILLVLYLLVGFTPLFGAMDYDAPEWLYVSLLNIVSLIFIFKNKLEFQAFVVPKHVKLYFYLYLGFFVISCLSMITAINVSESLVHLARLLSMIVGMYCLYIFVRQNPKAFFEFASKVIILIIIYFSWRAVSYSLGNWSSPRVSKFIADFPHNFSSINIYTAFIVVQLPFAFYGCLMFKKIWKYIATLSVFMGMYALLFAGSRTALLSLAVILIVLIPFLVFQVFKNKANLKLETVLLVFIPLASLTLILNVNRIDKSSSNDLSDIYFTKSAEDIKDQLTISNNNDFKKLVPVDTLVEAPNGKAGAARLSLWRLAFANFKEHPLLGIGYGNYKAVAKKEHNKSLLAKTFSTPRRAHNDFMEKLAETGIVGFLLYVALFIFPFWIWIKSWRNEKEIEKRIVMGVLFLSSIAYGFDALLNFPIERAPVQMHFLLVIIFILVFHKGENKSSSFTPYQLPIMALLFLGVLASITSNYAVLKSYQLQRIMREDLMGKTLFTDQKLANTYESIKEQWMTYPELSYVGTVNSVYLANYAIKAKKYEEALDILERSKSYNKDAFLVKAFKAEIYLNVYDNVDSTKYYSESIFDGYPTFKTNYNLLKGVYKAEKDSVNLFRVMNRYTKYAWNDKEEWVAKANTVYDFTKDSKLMLKVLDTGIAYNPSSLKLLEAKKEVLDKLNFKSYLSDKEVKAKHQEAFDYFATQEYDKAKSIFKEILKTNPKDYLSIQNIGIVDLVKKNYKEAIKSLTVVINANAFTDGKSEYSRGYCYEQLGELEKAKEDYKKSRSKNYSQAMYLPASKYE